MLNRLVMASGLKFVDMRNCERVKCQKGLNDINLRWYKNGDAERRAFGESASTYILINPISRYFNVITFVVPITIIMVKRFNGSRQKAFCIRLICGLHTEKERQPSISNGSIGMANNPDIDTTALAIDSILRLKC